MAENKKSFIAYADWKETFDALDNEKAGELIKHIFAYVNDENPVSKDMLINAVFASIRQTLKRDLRKWEKQYNQRVEAGKKSAKVRQRNSTVVNGRSVSSTVSVSVSDNISKDIYKSFAHLSITNDEYGKLCKEYGQVNTDNILDQIENYKANNKYKSLYLTAKNWLKKLPKNENEDKLLKKAIELGYVK